MDEPTSSLTEKEVEHLFKIIKKLKESGVGIVYISHKMEEIKMISDEITILRDGKSNSNLIVEKGKKHHCHYVTPYGEMMVGIYTHEIKNELNEHGGKLYMKYTVDINSSYISDNEIYMDIKVIEN